MEKRSLRAIVLAFAVLFTASGSYAQVQLIAKGSLTGSSAGANKDLSGLNYSQENGVHADLLGGIGSGITHVSGSTFLAIPDRGPNATPYNSLVDDTASYVPRFHTVEMTLVPNAGTGLPFTIAPQLVSTTLLYSSSPLTYGTGVGFGLPSGEPIPNRPSRNYFSGRSDNYDATRDSGEAKDARLDPESIRISNDGAFIYISDEYGPYVYQFLRASGQRVRSFRLPDEFYVLSPRPTTTEEIAANPTGRTPNKGMEGLAITPDGKTLVGIIQAPFIEDAPMSAPVNKLLRIVTIDATNGKTTHEYAYLLTTGSGVSEITALNDHEFLVDERDGKGLGDGSKAKIKQVFKIDLDNAVDVMGMSSALAATYPVTKTLFLDMVTVLKANGITDDKIPAKLEGLTLGPDVNNNGTNMHTLWVANDNDFLPDFGGVGNNPNQFFVFGFTDADLNGSVLVLQDVHLPRGR